MTNQHSGTDPKLVAIISYITFIGWLVALILNSSNRSSIGSFHIRQALGIYLLAFVSSIVIRIPIIGWIAGLAGFILVFLLWLIGLMAAVKGEETVVPVFGKQFQEWFRSL